MIEKILNIIHGILNVIGGVFLVLCSLYVAGNVIIRAVFGVTLKGTYEVAGLTAAVFCSAAIAMCALKHSGITADFITSRLQGVSREVMEYIEHIVDFAAYLIMMLAGGKVAMQMLSTGESTDTLRIPVGPVRLFWVLCTLIVIFTTVLEIIGTHQKYQTSGARETGYS